VQKECAGRHTFVVWLKLGEFLLRSVEPISESGRPLPFVGEAVGVLFMRSGDTCDGAREYAIGGVGCAGCRVLTASLRDMLAAVDAVYAARQLASSKNAARGKNGTNPREGGVQPKR
jgi:hypothetical protein